MSFSIINHTLAAAVADAGTFTISYPSGKDEGSFYQAMGHKIAIEGGSLLSYPADFGVTLGASNITIINDTGGTLAAGTVMRIQIEEQGQRAYRDGDTGNLIESSVESKGFLINLGAPDTVDTNGYVESQDLTAAGVFSVNATAAAAIAAAALTGTADVPRGLVAAWTTTAVLTVTGTDAYGNTLVESSASGTSFNSTKAFKTVTDVSTSVDITGLTVGTSDLIGIPMFIPSGGQVIGVLQDGVKLPATMELSYEFEQTQLLAATPEFIVTPYAGIIERNTVVTQAAVTTGGAITTEIGGVAVTGLSVVVADAAAAGDIDTDVPTDVSGLDTTTRVAARGAIEMVPAAAFATAGEVNGIVTVNTQGVITAGERATGGSIATTGDVRGTYVPPVACDGAAVYQLIVSLPDPGFIGISQYAG